MNIAARYATHIGLVASGTLIPGPREQVLTTHNLEQVYGRVSGLTSQVLSDGVKAAEARQTTGGSPT